MISRSLLLPASIALNVALAAAIIGVVVSPTQPKEKPGNLVKETAATKQSTAATNRAPTLDSAADEESEDYFRALSAKGLKPAERATLLLAHLNRKYEKQLLATGYWQGRTSMAHSMAVAARLRTDLLAIMGQEAWLEPGLASLFQPYQREFPNLDPRKQVEVQQLIQRYFLAHEQLQADRSAYREVIGNSYQQLQAGVVATLTAAEYEEYLVRLSPLADAIRRMQLNVDEQQFRQLVGFVNRNEHLARLTMRLEGRQTSLKLYDAELTRLLGRERHIEFISQIDPLYASLVALARNKAVAPEKVNAVYAAFVSEQGTGRNATPESAAQLARSSLGAGAELIMKQFVNQAARS